MDEVSEEVRIARPCHPIRVYVVGGGVQAQPEKSGLSRGLVTFCLGKSPLPESATAKV